MIRDASHPASITVVGAGAVGSLLAARLCHTDARVSLLARGPAARSIEEEGLTLLDGEHAHHARPRVVLSGAEAGVQDIVLLAVKLDQVSGTAPHLASMVGPQTYVVSAMNGLPWGFAETLPPPARAALVGDPLFRLGTPIESRQIAGCLVFVNCSRVGTGVVRRNAGHHVVLGTPAAGPSRPIAAFATLLEQAGFEVRLSPDIRLELWDKLIGNAVLNPLSALVRRSIGDICDDTRTRSRAVAAMTELTRLGDALGLACAASPAQRLDALRPLRSSRTSMLQDVLAGRPTEVEAMVGPLLTLSDAMGVAMPVMSHLFALAHMLKIDPPDERSRSPVQPTHTLHPPMPLAGIRSYLE
jgi:2-dehydropantoate 2-reductase